MGKVRIAVFPPGVQLKLHAIKINDSFEGKFVSFMFSIFFQKMITGYNSLRLWFRAFRVMGLGTRTLIWGLAF